MFQTRSFRHSALAIVLLFFIFPSCTPPQDELGLLLTRLVSESALVVLADVVKVSDQHVVADPFGGLHLAAIRPDEILLDRNILPMYRGMDIELLFRKSQSHSPNFVVGQRKLLFIVYCENGPKVVGGVHGSITQVLIDDGFVDVPLGKKIELTALKRRIERMAAMRPQAQINIEAICGRSYQDFS